MVIAAHTGVMQANRDPRESGPGTSNLQLASHLLPGSGARVTLGGVDRRMGMATMTKRDAENRHHMYSALESLGLTFDECEAIRRCSMTLHRWAEHECNGVIQRDETTEKPYVHSTHDGRKLYPCADREAGAIRRAEAIAKAHGLTIYHQGDPRGASLYILRPGDVPAGSDVDSCYSRGIAVY